MVIKECIICGKEFTPHYNMIDRQKCCSKDCFKVHYQRWREDWYRNNHASILQKARKDSRLKNKDRVICKLCGKPIETPNASGWRPRYHEKCIFDDCAEAIKRGERVSATQYNRLRVRGYGIADVKDYIDGRLKIIS